MGGRWSLFFVFVVFSDRGKGRYLSCGLESERAARDPGLFDLCGLERLASDHGEGDDGSGFGLGLDLGLDLGLGERAKLFFDDFFYLNLESGRIHV